MVTGRFNVRNRERHRAEQVMNSLVRLATFVRGCDSDMIHAELTRSDRRDTRVGLLSERVHRQYSKITAMKRIPIP